MAHCSLRPFHFWCQKVLPLVFDDSLSYYEVLGKMRDYLNRVIEEVNSIGSEFDGIKSELETLKDYVDNWFQDFDLSQAISDKLDSMVETGEMDTIIAPVFAAYANPIFVGSTADMMVSDFAYVNYENDKIYYFNPDSGAYESTGKLFGGVVASVDNMTDTTKIYALDSNGRIYSYHFPAEEFIETVYSFGGYRYGINAMRPIGNSYVLTTDNHVYMWNGCEYSDTGVVYGAASTSFIWRRALTNKDSFVSLNDDGWYSFKSSSLPKDGPDNLDPSDGFAVVFTNPDSTSNSSALNTQSENIVQSQRAQNLKADSRFKRVIIKTANGGSWLWNGENWISENENGFPLCSNCDNVTWNSVVVCDENTLNTPDENAGVLKTLCSGDAVGQMFFDEENVWFRYSQAQWTRLVREQEHKENERLIGLLFQSISAFNSYQEETRSLLIAQSNLIYDRLGYLQSSLTSIGYSPIHTEHIDRLLTENNSVLLSEILVLTTDTSLTDPNGAANAKSTGDALIEANSAIHVNSLNIATLENSTNEKIIQTYKNMQNLIVNVASIAGLGVLTENEKHLFTENSNSLQCEMFLIKTDKSLSQEDFPADALSTGNELNNINSKLENINLRLSSVGDLAVKNSEKINGVTVLSQCTIVSQNGNPITTQAEKTIEGYGFTVVTDKTLSKRNVAADSEAVGNNFDAVHRIMSNFPKADERTRVQSAGAVDYTLASFNLIGDLPTTKSYVPMSYKFICNDFTYEGPCEVKIQGNSSVWSPSKNFTIKLPLPLELPLTSSLNNIPDSYVKSNKWNLKADYIDPTHIRNLLGANLWSLCLQNTLNQNPIFYSILTQNNASITTQNGEYIGFESYPSPVLNRFNNGATAGKMCSLFHNSAFYGVCNYSVVKDELFAIPLNSKGWSVEAGPIPDISHIPDNFEIQEKGASITNEQVWSDISNFLTAVLSASDENFIATFEQYADLNLWLAYISFALYIQHGDGIIANQLWYKYQNSKIGISVWDMDATFGNGTSAMSMFQWGESVLSKMSENPLLSKIISICKERLKTVYKSLRDTTLNAYTVMNLASNIQKYANETWYTNELSSQNRRGKTTFHNISNIVTFCLANENICDNIIERL